jgi:hypothetical protein
MGVDQDGQHAEGFIIFDKAHASHIGGEVVNVRGAVDGDIAVRLRLRSRQRFSTSSNFWYHSLKGLTSTARSFEYP